MPARVLVVSAQAEIQLQLGNMLRRDGHEILVGNDGADGFRRWGTDRPDLIALDAELPDLPGLDVAMRIRQAEAPGFHTPIVVLGPSTDIDTKVRALRAGISPAGAPSSLARALAGLWIRPPHPPRGALEDPNGPRLGSGT